MTIFVIVGVVIIYSFLRCILSNFPFAELGGAVFADVEGANVVGYQTKQFPGNAFRLAAIQFEGLSGGANLNDLVPCSSEVSQEDNFTSLAPHIQVQKANGTYNYYYYITDAWYGWDEKSGEDFYKPGWSDSSGVLATPELYKTGDAEADGEVTAGHAVWFKDQESDVPVDMKSNGQIIKEYVDTTVPEAFRLRAGAFPVSFNLNDENAVRFSDMPVAYANTDNPDYLEKAAHIQVQKPNGTYYYYYYVQDAWYGWDEESGNDFYKAGWCDSSGVLATPELFESGDAESDGVVGANAAFWARGTTGSFSIRYFSPVK